ncbi:MAG: glycosyltransferase family 2 protein [Candidatus Izemoplasmatales bacterium]
MENKLFSILIPTHSKFDLIRGCLSEIRYTLCYHDKIDFDWEVIVVGNQCTPEIKELLEYYKGLKVFENKIKIVYTERNVDFSRVNNIAYKEASGQWILLMNDDCFPTDNWLNELKACIERHPKAGIVGGKLFYPQSGLIQHAGVAFREQIAYQKDGKDVVSKLPFHVNHNVQPNDPRVEIEQQFPCVTFALAAIKRELWDKLGGLKEFPEDPAFPYNYEDVDFCLQTKTKTDFEIWYAPKCICGHYCSQTNQDKTQWKPEVMFKYLPRFQQEWNESMVCDGAKYEKMDIEGIVIPPKIAIGIPLSEYNDVNWDSLTHNLMRLSYYRKRIHVYFHLNNCGVRFQERVLNWIKLNGQSFGGFNLPSNIMMGNKLQNIVDARNKCIEFAKGIKADYLFFWDADVVIPNDTLQKLIALKSDIACGVTNYKNRIVDNIPMLFLKREDIKEQDAFVQTLKTKKEFEVMDLTSDPAEKCFNIGIYRFAKELLDGGIHDCDASGMGCTLINKDVFKAVDFESLTQLSKEKTKADFEKILFNLPLFEVNKKGFGTEDLWWFYKAGRLGFKSKVDTGIKNYHVGQGIIN